MQDRILASLLLLCLAAPAAQAHEFWIEPSTFHPALGTPVLARILVGENFQGDPVARKESHIRRFVLAGAAGETPFLGAEGRDPAGFVRIDSPGLQLIGYESNATAVTLDADKLGIYIELEGLEPFFKGDRKRPIDDYFSRCAKSLLLAGDPAPGAKGFDRRLGCPLELIPEADPYAALPGDGLPFLLLWEGKPLANAQISARRQEEPLAKLKARSDAAGRVTLPVSAPGVWLVNAVFIRPATSGEPGAWESFWASLTFEIPAAPLHPSVPASRRGN